MENFDICHPIIISFIFLILTIMSVIYNTHWRAIKIEKRLKTIERIQRENVFLSHKGQHFIVQVERIDKKDDFRYRKYVVKINEEEVLLLYSLEGEIFTHRVIEFKPIRYSSEILKVIKMAAKSAEKQWLKNFDVLHPKPESYFKK